MSSLPVWREASEHFFAEHGKAFCNGKILLLRIAFDETVQPGKTGSQHFLAAKLLIGSLLLIDWYSSKDLSQTQNDVQAVF